MSQKRINWNLFERIKGDEVVWTIVLILILMSVVCNFSSSSRLLVGELTRLDIVWKQLKVVALGLGVILVLYNVKDISFFRKVSPWLFPFSVFLLILLLSKIDLGFIKSAEYNGARRVLEIKGLQVHVFEIVKVSMVLYLAWAQDALRKGELKGPAEIKWQKVMYLYAPFLIIFVMVLTGSNTAALFIGAIMFFSLLLGGGNFKDLLLVAVMGIITVMICFGLFSATKHSEHVMFQRIGTAIGRLFDPVDWEQKVVDSRTGSVDYYEALDEIRQPFGAKIAVKEGGLLGKGPGQSTQRYAVPDMSEDYMFSFILEEYGLLGGILVICLYVSLLARGALIAKNCGDDEYAKLVIAGLCLMITGQAFLHMFVNADIGPMTGQTLPLISHGNSAFLCFCAAFGIILSISRIAEKRMEQEQEKAEALTGEYDDIAEEAAEYDN